VHTSGGERERGLDAFTHVGCKRAHLMPALPCLDAFDRVRATFVPGGAQVNHHTPLVCFHS
jgi:hypothetical protein